MCKSDELIEPKTRHSYDNGRTWTEFETEPEIMSRDKDSTVFGGEGIPYYDPTSGCHISISMRQTRMKGPPERTYTHGFWRFSDDGGKTWDEHKLLRYEDGHDFDPDNPYDLEFLNNNQFYNGGMIRHSNGTVILSGTGTNIPKDAPDPDPERKYEAWRKAPDARSLGSLCFVFRWDAENRRYDLRHSNCVWVPRRVSCRGLAEADLAELANGRVLIIWRGQGTDVTPGRKWFGTSDDGCLTISEVQELKYDDGSQFYSPGSIHRLMRNSGSGKLYWFANITPEYTNDAGPRYPLIIAEVDETIPAIKKDTVTIIDDREPGGNKHLQLSNFALLEDRETHEFQVYVTHLGTQATEEDPYTTKFLNADAYKYTLSFE